MKEKFKLGEWIWTIDYDEIDMPVGVKGMILIAIAPKHLICTSEIVGIKDYDRLMEYHVDETYSENGTDLSVYPITKCFKTRDEALAQLALEVAAEC